MSAARRALLASESRAFRSAARLTSAWTRRYTRDLDPDVAADRRNEIESDLWEHGSAADAGGATGIAAAASVVSRLVRGMPDDTAWRRDRDRIAIRPPQPWSHRASVAAAALVASVVLMIGIAAMTRICIAAMRGEFLPSALTITSTVVGTTALLCGLALFVRPRRRWLGGLWLAGASALVLPFGLLALITLSANVSELYYRYLSVLPPGWEAWWVLVVAAVTAFFVLLALAWSGADDRRMTSRREESPA